ncbi:sphingolipid transporter spinster-like protein 2 [Pyrus ussuriensis x Pyrus communis]|uniref:Sphingolipid transporter spinster-like protein 2 n=1 Tax=Pyrus ussuriensis x Pyrus communis TaxID=2448454 RepID=A0A5N5HXY5_9ROSA|nr:sphingolipid transporter spinster-like protein 2 [Pyrus ussuriensis x Pyrus communis]
MAQKEAKASEEAKPPSPAETSMIIASTAAPAALAAPSWFTPKRLLVIFCLINLLNYVDRGTIASNGVNGSRQTCTESGVCTPGTGIQGEFNLNNFQDGVLSSAFMAGLLIASPIFASLAKSVNPFGLIGVGLSVWTFATLGCGCSFGFWSIAVFRMLVGVGEASFISLAAPFIDDNAPAAQKTAWLSIFYMCISSGYALGYVYGGVVGSHTKWRYAFVGEAILMLPFAILGFVMKPFTDSRGNCYSTIQKPSNSKVNPISRFMKDMKVLLGDKVFVVNVLGYIAYNFVIGAYSYWGPKAGYNIYHMSNADMIFGGVTIACGILGTLGGGFLLDYMTGTISNAFKLLSSVTLIGGAFCLGAFWMKNLYAFLALFAIGQLLVFATQGPVNYVCLHCVKPSMRPLSMAISTVAIHLFGDVPSAPLVGVLQDAINNWRATALILTSIFYPAALIWFIGIFLHSVDRFKEESEHQITTKTETSNTTPMDEGKKIETIESVAEP